MIKTFNINLAGQIFNINEDAYESMSAYFTALRKFYQDEADKEEIIRDIESRFAEIFLTKGKSYIITKADADAVINMMGMPEDFDEETKEQNHGKQAGPAAAGAAPEPNGRRLYRDMDDSLVGGVCAGLSAYFGINDPIWIRLLFIISPFITFGSALLIYLILWIVIPEAKTSAQKLAMKGERINLLNIEKTVKDETGSAAAKSEPTSALGKVVNFIGEIARLLFKALLVFIKIIAFIVLGSLLIALFAVIISFIVAAIVGAPVASKLFFDDPGDSWLMMLGGTMSGMALIVFITLAIIHLISKTSKPLKRNTLLPIFGFFMAGLVLLGICANKASSLFAEKRKITQSVPLDFSTLQDTLQLNMATMEKEDVNIRINKFNDFMDYLGRDYVVTPDVDIRIYPSNSDSFRIVKEFSAFGRDEQEALQNATSIEHNMAQLNHKMLIDPYFSINTKNMKIRNQQLVIKVYVPEGKVIRWNERVEDFMDEGELPINWDKNAILAVRTANKGIVPPVPPIPPVPPVPGSNETVDIEGDEASGKKVIHVTENGKKVDIIIDEKGKHIRIHQKGDSDEEQIINIGDEDGIDRNIFGYEHYIFKMINGELVPLD